MKSDIIDIAEAASMSPSVWRVWIEIWMAIGNSADGRSPSVWRVWIEIMITDQRLNTNAQSPSVWRVWIEISDWG